MVRNHPLAKSIRDAGWSQFRTLLASKAACIGKHVVAAPARYASQECRSCGIRVQKSVSMCTLVCAFCGLVLDRDENAARNMLRGGRAFQGAVAKADMWN